MTYSRCTLQQSTVECISSLDLFNSSIIYIVCGKKTHNMDFGESTHAPRAH